MPDLVPVAVPDPTPWPGPDNDKVGSDGLSDVREFDFDHTDRRKRRWAGRFRVRILTIRDRLAVGLTKAQLANGVPFQTLDPSTANLLEMLAHLSVAVEVGPPWWKPLELRAFDVLMAVYAEVSSYEERFWGLQREEAPSPAEPGEPRLGE